MRSLLPWRRPEAPPAAIAADPGDLTQDDARDLARAARILAVRSRREATSVFAGSYASAFRGGGIEFDESRPYVPGDDVRYLDWNAMARSGEPFVKGFREERDETVLLALDVSASMRFGTLGRSKAATAAHAAALIAAAAGRVGDRVGLLAFGDQLRARIPASRGASHIWKVIATAVAAAGESHGRTDLTAAIEELCGLGRQRSVALLFSDFRTSTFSAAKADENGSWVGKTPFLQLSNLHDLVCVVLHDPSEEHLPRVGLIRVRDPEAPERTLLLNSSSLRVRTRFRRAWAVRAATLERRLRSGGADVVWMRTDRAPLQTLMHFFQQRARVGLRPRDLRAASSPLA